MNVKPGTRKRDKPDLPRRRDSALPHELRSLQWSTNLSIRRGGHTDVAKTQIYTHVFNRNASGVLSLLDRRVADPD